MTDNELKELVRKEGLDRVKQAIRSCEKDDKFNAFVEKNKKAYESLQKKYPTLTKDTFRQMNHFSSQLRMNLMKDFMNKSDRYNDEFKAIEHSFINTVRQAGLPPEFILDYQSAMSGGLNG